jgi:hypothetical protein
VRGIMAVILAFCSVLVGCDDGDQPEPGGAGGEAGEGGAAGEGGQAGEGGEGGEAGGTPGDTCDAETRCSTPGAVCREDRAGWRCVALKIPVGEECEDDDDCGGLAVGGNCSRRSEQDPRTCFAMCYFDTECPAGMVCDGGGEGICHPAG